MRTTAIRNVLVLAVMTAIGAVYFGRFASTVPKEWMLLLNFMVVPAALGAVSYQIFSGQPLVRLVLVSAIPILSILLAGGDPAKPGLELVLVGPLLIAYWTGAGAALAIRALFTARKRNRA